MRYASVDGFLEEGLAPLLAERAEAFALFASYNQVGRYPSGEVSTSNGTARAVVCNGHMPLDISVLETVAMGSTEEKAMLSAEIREDAARAQSEVETSVKVDVHPDLIFLYAGLSAFHEALSFGRRLSEHSDVIILTCDCKFREKSQYLESAMANGEIGHYIVTPRCGGRDDMGRILHAFLEASSE